MLPKLANECADWFNMLPMVFRGTVQKYLPAIPCNFSSISISHIFTAVDAGFFAFNIMEIIVESSVQYKFRTNQPLHKPGDFVRSVAKLLESLEMRVSRESMGG